MSSKNPDKNPFGGKNPAGLYVPMTDDEQEVLERLRDDHGFRIMITDWGYVDNPSMVFGDKRVSFEFQMTFRAPDVAIPVRSFEMSLWTLTGIFLFGPRTYPTIVHGEPLYVHTGLSLGLALDIAIDEISPHLMRMVKPGTIGLTTYHGNMHLTDVQQKILHDMRAMEAKVRAEDAKRAILATNPMPRR